MIWQVTEYVGVHATPREGRIALTDSYTARWIDKIKVKELIMIKHTIMIIIMNAMNS